MKQGDKTKKKILFAGVKLWPDVTPSTVAAKIGMTHAAVLYHFPGNTLKDAVAKHAVEIGESRVIVQLFVTGHKATDKLTHAERAKHLKAV